MKKFTKIDDFTFKVLGDKEEIIDLNRLKDQERSLLQGIASNQKTLLEIQDLIKECEKL